MGICWLALLDSYNSKSVLYSGGQWQGTVRAGHSFIHSFIQQVFTENTLCTDYVLCIEMTKSNENHAFWSLHSSGWMDKKLENT